MAKAKCKRSRAIVPRDRAAGHRGRLRRGAPLEDQQHPARAGIVGGQPAVREHRLEPHHVFVKALGARHVIDIEGCFENSVELGHR